MDTNVVLYLLKGDLVLQNFLTEKDFSLSFISELELLGFKQITSIEETSLRVFFEECAIFDVNKGIKHITVDLRRRYSLKLPNALVAATAIFLGIYLLSADKQFSQIDDLTFILYQP